MTQLQGYAALVSDGRVLPWSGRSLDEILDDLDSEIPVTSEGSLSDALTELRAGER